LERAAHLASARAADQVAAVEDKVEGGGLDGEQRLDALGLEALPQRLRYPEVGERVGVRRILVAAGGDAAVALLRARAGPLLHRLLVLLRGGHRLLGAGAALLLVGGRRGEHLRLALLHLFRGGSLGRGGGGGLELLALGLLGGGVVDSHGLGGGERGRHRRRGNVREVAAAGRGEFWRLRWRGAAGKEGEGRLGGFAYL
jgi:hypothetical protein